MAKLVTVVCGNAGTGKTTWAKQLAGARAAALLDLDTLSGPLVRAALAALGRDVNDRDSTEYKRLFREPVHESLLAVARECEGPVVIVAPFTRERSRSDFLQWLAARCGAPVEVHYFVTDEAVREARLRSRADPRDAAKFKDYAAYRAVSAGDERPAYPHRWFDTTERFPELSALD